MHKAELQNLLDYVAIRQLNAKYNRYADQADGESYSSLFTEDAQFHIVGEGTYIGREQIAARCNATTTAVHVTTEPELDISGDTAQQRVRMLTVLQDGEGTRNEFVASGWYIDELKRTAEGWRYHHRRVELDLDINMVLEKVK
ncbi:MAG: nuclear transport factor 2 family protein [Porticoccaceae bacterium]|nr:nuclear transport factor 2 family protein [Porticoccaceae bacterium]